MDSTLTLQHQIAWRLGQGGVPGCLSGSLDSGAFTRLDLNLVQIPPQNCVYTGCQFRQCSWDGLNFDFAQWRQVALLDCTPRGYTANVLRGEHVHFTGSHFVHLEFNNAQIS